MRLLLFTSKRDVKSDGSLSKNTVAAFKVCSDEYLIDLLEILNQSSKHKYIQFISTTFFGLINYDFILFSSYYSQFCSVWFVQSPIFYVTEYFILKLQDSEP